MSLLAMLDKTLTHKTQSGVTDAIGGETTTFVTADSDVPCAAWPQGSSSVRDLMRKDILGDFMVATAQDLSAKSGDLLVIGTDIYLVNGIEPYGHAGITSEVLYLHDCTKRTV